MSITKSRNFSPEFFRFLRELEKHNNRKWFSENKDRYERAVRDPCLRFIEDIRDPLKRVSQYLVADPKPFGGSLFRIYRDIRFSKDKSPYKTSVAMEFWHRRGGEKIQTPGLYLHLEPNNSFIGGGIWHPDQSTLNKVRRAIVNRPEAWRRVLDSKLEIEGDMVKRPPKGFDPNHQFIEDLKRKDFTSGFPFKNAVVTGSKFRGEFLEASKALNPLNEFLAKALRLPW
jgi:uncharacterized protein (TIGR02453 family)